MAFLLDLLKYGIPFLPLSVFDIKLEVLLDSILHILNQFVYLDRCLVELVVDKPLLHIPYESVQFGSDVTQLSHAFIIPK